MIILWYHEIFFQADSSKVSQHSCWCFQPEKISWYDDIVILSFCNIVKGQANCIDITKVMTIEVNTKVNIIIVLLKRDVVVLLKSLPSFITRYCIPSRNMCVQNFYDCCKVLEHFMTACGSNLNILQIGVITYIATRISQTLQ